MLYVKIFLLSDPWPRDIRRIAFNKNVGIDAAGSQVEEKFSASE